MDKKNPQLILWLWLGGIFIVIAIIGITARCKTTVAGQPLQAQAGMQIQPGTQTQIPMDTQAGAGMGMNTGALENTYNQIADVMNRITVSIYTTGVGQAQPQLLGSGVVVSKQLVLTNAHIVNNGGDLSVAFTGSQQASYPVAIFRCDAANDFALLQVTNNMTFPIVGMLGDSSRVDRGDIVFATGNAFGTGNVLANGMIIDNNFSYVFNGKNLGNKFRTNINIYPGSCGGPLVNIKGEVIGINNSLGLAENNYMGLGYATPVNAAAALINSTVQNQGGAPKAFMPVAFNSGNPYVLT